METYETWVDIPGEWLRRYQVSSSGGMRAIDYYRPVGRGRPVRPGPLTAKIDADGYRRVGLTASDHRKRTVKIARLVAFVFVPNDAPDKKVEVDHVNANEADDRKENLEWVTPTEQQRRRAARMRKAGRLSSRFIGVTRNNRDQLWYAQVWANGKRVHIGCYQDETVAARAYDRHVADFGLSSPVNDWSVELET